MIEEIKKQFLGETQIEVVDKLSYKDFYSHFSSTLTPVVIKNGLGNIPALKKWNVEYLREKVGGKKIKLNHHHNAKFEWSMDDFFQELTSDDNKAPKHYLTQANITTVFPELIDDVKPYPQYALSDWKCNRLLPKNMHYVNYLMELLLGKAGTGFFMHYDRGFMNAFVGQVSGEKEVVLIPPEDKVYLYPREDECARSNVDIWDLDLEKFPLAKNSRPAFYTLQAGDLVYIPAGWWHSTRNKTQSIGITYNNVNRGNWKIFSDFMIENYRQADDTKYPTFVLITLLKIVGCIERLREFFMGVKPREGSLKSTWK